MKSKQTAGKPIPVTRGSGNVFADLGLPNPEERLAKAELALAISRAIKERGLTQREAATLMGIDQPKVKPRESSVAALLLRPFRRPASS